MAVKRFPRTGTEALQAMLDHRYQQKEIVQNLDKHGGCKISLSLLTLVKQGKRTIKQDGELKIKQNPEGVAGNPLTPVTAMDQNICVLPERQNPRLLRAEGSEGKGHQSYAVSGALMREAIIAGDSAAVQSPSPTQPLWPLRVNLGASSKVTGGAHCGRSRVEIRYTLKTADGVKAMAGSGRYALWSHFWWGLGGALLRLFQSV